MPQRLLTPRYDSGQQCYTTSTVKGPGLLDWAWSPHLKQKQVSMYLPCF